MNPDQLLLIDLSGIAHMLWHVSGNEPDQDFVSNQIVARVHALSAAHPHTAICLDSGTSFRKALDPTYKAQRDTENRAPLQHQIGLAVERLRQDGYPCWTADGFEADDVIATATAKALAIDGATVLIASADKDLLQLVNDRVTAKSLTNGTVYDEAAVVAKLKVKPSQVLDYLSLTGDVSDAIVGAKGIGGAIAARLLQEHGDLVSLYAKIDQGVVKGVTPGMRTSLQEFRARWPVVRQLIALRTDVEIPFEEIAAERTAAPMDASDEPQFDEPTEPLSIPSEPEAARPVDDGKGGERVNAIPEPRKVEPVVMQPDMVLTGGAPSKPQEPSKAVQAELIAAPPPAEWELQLEPRSYRDTRVFSQDMHTSRKFVKNFGTPEAIIATVVSGRELGIPAMASLRGFYSFEGGIPQPYADTVRGIIIKSGKVEYFECTERSDEAAEFATKRPGRPEIKLRYTIEEAKRVFFVQRGAKESDKAKIEKEWATSNYAKNPADMLVARASMKLGRLVCPDVVGGLYAVEEVE